MAEKEKGYSSSIKPRLVEELVAKVRVLAIVNGVLRTTLAAGSLQEVLLALAPNLKELCPFDRLSVSLFDPRRGLLHTPYAYTKAAVTETGEPPRAAEGTPAGKVLETRKPALKRHAGREKVLATDTAALRRGPGCEAWWPLLAGERPFGTFQVSCLEPDRLDDDHLRAVEEILPAVASAVHRFAGVMPQ